MDEAFLRTEMLLGAAALETLRRSHVAVFGLGGVGSWAAEGLARSGVGALTLVDQDTVGLSNLNRQLCALHSTLDRPKADVMAERVRDINPHCAVTALARRYEPAAREDFFARRYDYIIDAIDLVSCKLDLIQTALGRSVPIVSALGTGNKRDASAFRITDIAKTEMCPLARVLRKELRRRGIHHHRVLWSAEDPARPVFPDGYTLQSEAPPGRRAVPGSVPWVTACAGFLLSGDVVQRLIG
jgi:tRNA A37 threonylcarbamoyladenosine dehydratase